jgi:hypothetical protein
MSAATLCTPLTVPRILQSLSCCSRLPQGRELDFDTVSRNGNGLGLQRAITLPRAGGSAYKPRSFGIGADPGHQEHRKPSTNVPTEASG